MEESEEILLNSLQSCGILIPLNVTSIRAFTPTTLVSLCSQALNLIDRKSTAWFPTSLPDSVADQLKICTELASAIKELGYIGDMSFHKFLYPSEEDFYRVVRFLVERLSEASENGKTAVGNDVTGKREVREENFKFLMEDSERVDNERASLNIKVENKFSDLRVTNQVTEFSNATTSKPSEACVSLENRNEEFMDDMAHSETQNFFEGGLVREPRNRDSGASGNEETALQIDDGHVSLLGQKVTSIPEKTCKTISESQKLRNQERTLKEEVSGKTVKLQHLQGELDLIKTAAAMAFDDHHPVDFYLKQLEEQLDSKKRNLLELKSQWDAEKESLEKRKLSLEELLCANTPEAREILHKLRDIELEKECILSEIRRRKEEHSKLSTDFEKQPKQAPRSSYINRVKEISKNSRKQDADIERILKETRELQLESNSIQERLHRTYAVVDELVFREAKKDAVGQQAYKLLTSIHESFERISEKILATDRTRREAAEHEKKLAALASRRLNVDKLQADLDAIKRENENLEHRLTDC